MPTDPYLGFIVWGKQTRINKLLNYRGDMKFQGSKVEVSMGGGSECEQNMYQILEESIKVVFKR